MSTESLYEKRDRILAQLDALRIFPNTKTVRQLRRELKEKLRELEAKIDRFERQEHEPEIEKPDDSDDTIEDANSRRSARLKRYHRYIRLIRDNFPEYTYTQIRKQLADRKRGKEVDIPDVVWQNPSP